MFSLSAALIIPNLSISLLAHPPDKTADTDELSYTVLRVIQQKKNGVTDPLQQKKCHTNPQGSQKPCPCLACTDCATAAAAPADVPLFSTASQETKQTKTLLTEDGQSKGQVSKGLADQNNQSHQ